MTTYKIAELEGALLDAAVAMAEGKSARVDYYPCDGYPKWICRVYRQTMSGAEAFAPSTLWEVGGPIIERERINVECFGDTDGRSGMRDVFWCGSIMASMVNNNAHDAHGEGETPLIAAMRAYVASKLGETVELP